MEIPDAMVDTTTLIRRWCAAHARRRSDRSRARGPYPLRTPRVAVRSLAAALALVLAGACSGVPGGAPTNTAPPRPASDVTPRAASDTAGATSAVPAGAAYGPELAPLVEAVRELPAKAAVPLAPDIVSGTLANGLRYFIRPNQEPKNRVEMRFVVDAGSVHEEKDQRGLAHFLEHMLFNGTERFPANDVIALLQSTGMEVGPDVNAYTGYDHTVYVVKLPTDNPQFMPLAFDIMEDWASRVLLDPQEVEAERGVIVEERRLRLSSEGRTQRVIDDLYLRGSRYAERQVIGDLEVIQTAPRERLASFYEKWYRPENMAIVVVGDIDPKGIEALILERFQPLVNPEEPAAPPPTQVPAHGEPLYAVVTDPEQPSTQVVVTWKRPAPNLTTMGAYKDFLVAQMFDNLMNLRLLEAAETAGSPILGAQAGRGLRVRSLEIWQAAALAPEGRTTDALEALLTEVERVKRHGFTESELARIKREIATRYARAAAEQQFTPSADLADELVRHVTTDEPVPGILLERELTKRFLPKITLADLAREVSKLSTSSRVVLAVLPDKPGLTPPTEASLRSVVADVAKATIDPYEDTDAVGELMPEPPEPAAITSRREIPEIGATELILANGARVLYKRTELRSEEVLFAASSPGGTSMVPDDDYAEASLAAEVIAEGGVGQYSRPELIRLLAGTDVAVAPEIARHFEGLSGAARTPDLPALFQLAHLLFTAPRLDPNAVARVQAEYVSRLENLGSVPAVALREAIAESLYGNNVRAGLLPLAEIRALDASRLFKIYRERFADASDFVFCFVGSFEPAALEDLARRYLGTLPSTRSKEQYREVLPDAPQDVIRRTVARGKESRSQVQIVFEGRLPEVDAQSYLVADLLSRAMAERINPELREVRGAVYGVLIDVQVAEVPRPTYRATIDFTTDPQRVDELIEVVWKEIAALREDGPDTRALRLNKRTLRRSREEALGSNGFWLGVLQSKARLPSFEPVQVPTYDERLEAITAEEIRQLAVRILREDRYVQVVLTPEDGVLPAGGSAPEATRSPGLAEPPRPISAPPAIP
jgi:zinc protease